MKIQFHPLKARDIHKKSVICAKQKYFKILKQKNMGKQLPLKTRQRIEDLAKNGKSSRYIQWRQKVLHSHPKFCPSQKKSNISYLMQDRSLNFLEEVINGEFF